MGRTRRKRKRKQIFRDRDNDLTKVINLQKSLRLKCPSLQVHYFNGFGWGMRSKKKIDKGDILIALPFRHLITTNVPCEIFDVLKMQNRPPQFLLSAFLIYESHLKKKSKYFEYIESLPKSFTNLYFCTNEEVELLPKFIRNEIVEQSNIINGNLQELFQIIHGKSCPHCKKDLRKIFIYEKFVWAWFNVNTRSVYYHDDKKTKSLALAPFLDLFNHSNSAETELVIDFVNELYILKTYTSYKKFEQIFIKYGVHTNLKLLLEYGFILPENDDFFEFSFEEVLECVREFNYIFGEIPKLKYNFVMANKLNQNLIKSMDYFSWNFHGLVYVLITEDQNLETMQAKTYSNSFTSAEKNIIQKICEIASKKKFKEFQKNLTKMEKIDNCTESFELVKNLVKNYMKMLQ